MLPRSLLQSAALAGALVPLTLSAADPTPSPAQILQDLRSFATTGTVLHVAAHPDDENTELITWLSRGRGYRTAYLSLTRGDGGQNELGKDFDEKLGVLRTQELLAARKLDGGRQFFTRAIDFGYSKSPEETLRFWDHKEVLADVVRIYRQFRPDVVVTRFPIPPGSGGHGQHTASGILAVEAFKLAGDPNAYPEQIKEGLAPWQPKRVLWNSFRIGSIGPGSLDGPVHRQDIGGKDPVTGEEFGAIAALSRSRHGTQGLFGAANRARTGANEQAFMLLAGEPVSGSDLMDGVDTTWHRYPGGAEIQRLTEKLIASFNSSELPANVPALLELADRLRKIGARDLDGIALRAARAPPRDPVLDERLDQLKRIILACIGLTLRANADRPEYVAGEAMTFQIEANGAGETTVRFSSVGVGGNGYQDLEEPSLELGKPLAWTTDTVHLPLTQPYWLRADGAAGISRVDDHKLLGYPEAPPSVIAYLGFKLQGRSLLVAVPVLHGDAPPRIVAPVSLRFDSDVNVIAPAASKPIAVHVTGARANTSGTLRLEAPAGWKIAPASHAFSLSKAGDRATFTFTLASPAAASTAASPSVSAVAETGGRTYSHQRIELRYDHLPVQLLQPPARARLVSTDVTLRAKNIGYLPGAGDATAEALQQLGANVRMLTGADLTPEKLAGLDAVVIGVRAFNERADLKDAFPGLLAWVEQGGTVVAQYNRPNGLLAEQLGPYELSLAGPAPQNRVTDETAPVSFLVPDHPALNVPNRITAADFEGWVQERGAYFPSKWDESKYTALLAMSDPGEKQPNSSVLIARHGRGHYVYTSLAFFRQLPAGVPGAYRLLANLVSLGK